jgi:hypothetical protein
MTSSSLRIQTETVGVRDSAAPRHDAHHIAPVDAIRFATLCADVRLDDTIRDVEAFTARIGVPLKWEAIPTHLARGGTVGRIGVPQAAAALMLRQQVVIGSSANDEPLAPVSRLWRGLERRADVLIELRQCTTLPGSAAADAGVERDILLVSQRLVERNSPKQQVSADHDSADLWARARESADLVYRLAGADQRNVLLVLPVGRATAPQQLFSDALARQARLHRMTPPRTVKAGLLSALLTGDTGRERWLVASVMPIAELAATADEAIGATGPWPVIGLGRHATFCGMPRAASGQVDVVPLLLVLEFLMRRAGQVDLARDLLHAMRTTMAALHRAREEFGSPFELPVPALLQGIISNWGRLAPSGAGRDRRGAARAGPEISGLKLRIESALAASELRALIAAPLMRGGLEVASVRNIDAAPDAPSPAYEVRVRSRLGEPPLADDAAQALVNALGKAVHCTAVEPWIVAGAAERGRTRPV